MMCDVSESFLSVLKTPGALLSKSILTFVAIATINNDAFFIK